MQVEGVTRDGAHHRNPPWKSSKIRQNGRAGGNKDPIKMRRPEPGVGQTGQIFISQITLIFREQS